MPREAGLTYLALVNIHDPVALLKVEVLHVHFLHAEELVVHVVVLSPFGQVHDRAHDCDVFVLK